MKIDLYGPPSLLCIEICAPCKYCVAVSLARCECVHLQCDGGIMFL